MHKRIVSFVKYNKVILALYRFFGNLFMMLLSLFVRVNDKKILFVSYGGQKYDDSPKELYLKIKEDSYFKDFELIWAFYDVGSVNIDCKKVKIDSLKYYITALSSRIWVTNSSMERGLNIKRKKTIEINTCHGTALKKVGPDIESSTNVFKSKRKKKKKGVTYYCAQSEYDRDIFTRLFDTTKEFIMISGFPRNDNLLLYTEEEKNKIKKTLGISQNKKVILYAPTFREYDRDGNDCCYINPPIDFKKWREKIGDEYVVLFRAHYEVVSVLGVKSDDFVIDVSSYHYLNDLLVISDILISDYSSMYFDFSVLGRPMLKFAYDYDRYLEFRGVYLNLKEELGCNINLDEDSLLEEILTMDTEKYCQAARTFREKYVPKVGHAGEIVIGKLKELIEEKY